MESFKPQSPSRGKIEKLKNAAKVAGVVGLGLAAGQESTMAQQTSSLEDNSRHIEVIDSKQIRSDEEKILDITHYGGLAKKPRTTY